jgi:RNA polymerase sigma-70 factor (ECF subfamily)
MMTVQISEQTLITRASKGDLDAFNQLVLNYQDIAYRHASALTGDPDSAEDIMQESFIKVFQNMSGFRGGSFRAWLLKILANTSRDQWRRTKRHPTIPLFPQDEDGEEIEAPAWLADPTSSIETTVQQREESHQQYRTLDGLPTVYRSVITLIDVNELDYAEAAEILRVPLGTVKSRLARARMQMKDKLQGNLNLSLSWAM